MQREKPDYCLKYPALSKALYQALGADPFYSTLETSHENPNTARESMLKYLDYSMVEAAKYGELYIPAEHEYGVSVWTKPLTPALEAEKKIAKRKFLAEQMGQACEQTYASIVEFMSAKSATIVNERYWYLSIVGIVPAFQGQGLGTHLVNAVLESSDELGFPTYLETFTPRNEAFYGRLGYKKAGSFHEPTTQSNYSLMIREPAGA